MACLVFTCDSLVHQNIQVMVGLDLLKQCSVTSAKYTYTNVSSYTSPTFWEHNLESWSIKGSGFTLQSVYFINLRHSR